MATLLTLALNYKTQYTFIMHKYQHPCLRRDSNQQLDAAMIALMTSAAWLSDPEAAGQTSLACSFSWCMLWNLAAILS
jgi:hypothetical protein